MAGSLTFLDDILIDVQKAGILEAVAKRNTPKIFDWLLNAFSYQGISDQVARSYIRKHGNVTFSERDVANGDLVGWIDDRLENPQSASICPCVDLAADRQERLIGPLRNIYGVSDKILTMTLSGLLLGASDGRPHWFETGKGMIAIDTLVHNFLHRTGILDDCGASHAYGVGCYGNGGCAEIIRAVASQIDASAFNTRFPRVFPRFVQHAIWRFCAADGLNICNGNRIDDRKSCENRYCQVFGKCDRKSLK